ncbi:hypothetical protein Tco_0453585 [Tanacetum coccineum]
MLAPNGRGLILYQAYGNLYAITEPRDGVATIKRRRHDIHGDGVRDSVTASGRGRLKVDLEPSTWRRRQEYKATPSPTTTASRSLANVEAYDPEVKNEFMVAVSDFENVLFALLDELESLKDSPLASIVSTLVLKDGQGNVDSTPEL